MSDFLEVLLHESEFVRSQIGQITQLRITESQKIKTIQCFCNYELICDKDNWKRWCIQNLIINA